MTVKKWGWRMLTPIKKNRVYEGVAQQIKEQIEKGIWKEGERIQSELELAKTFQVSRGSIREAIKSLQMAGLLEAHSGQGTFVSANACEKIRASRLNEKLNSAEYFDDVLECRHLIEVHACGVAATCCTEEDLQYLRENYEQIIQYTLQGDTENMNRCGMEFHAYIVNMMHNEIISDFYQSIMQALLEERREFFQNWYQLEITESHYEHMELIQAFEAHDSVQAQQIMGRHLDRKRRGKKEVN